MPPITNNTLNWIFKSIQIIAVIAMPVIAYVWTNLFERISIIEKDIVVLRLEEAKTTNTHFTVSEWNNVKGALDTKVADFDKRITKTEEGMAYLKEMISDMRIEQKEKLNEISKNQKEMMEQLTRKSN